MIDITAWMDGFLKALHDTFGNRMWFVGLQGSYGRGDSRGIFYIFGEKT